MVRQISFLTYFKIFLTRAGPDHPGVEFSLTMFEDPGCQLPESITRFETSIGSSWVLLLSCYLFVFFVVLSFCLKFIGCSWVAMRALPDFIANMRLACLKLRTVGERVFQSLKISQYTAIPYFPGKQWHTKTIRIKETGRRSRYESYWGWSTSCWRVFDVQKPWPEYQTYRRPHRRSGKLVTFCIIRYSSKGFIWSNRGFKYTSSGISFKRQSNGGWLLNGQQTKCPRVCWYGWGEKTQRSNIKSWGREMLPSNFNEHPHRMSCRISNAGKYLKPQVIRMLVHLNPHTILEISLCPWTTNDPQYQIQHHPQCQRPYPNPNVSFREAELELVVYEEKCIARDTVLMEKRSNKPAGLRM